MAHVRRDFAETEVDIDQGRLVAREPAGLNSDSAATDGPFGSVEGSRHATTLREGVVVSPCTWPEIASGQRDS